MKLSFIEQDITMLIPSKIFTELKEDLSAKDQCVIEKLIGDRLNHLGCNLYSHDGILIATSEL